MTAEQSITVTVRPFSGLQHMLGGAKQLAVGLDSGATVAALREVLAARYPVLEPFMSTYVIAVGEEVQEPTHGLRDGDVVDLIPPIAGG